MCGKLPRGRDPAHGRRDVLKKVGVAAPVGLVGLRTGSRGVRADHEEPDYSIVKDYQVREIDDGSCGLSYMPGSIDHRIVGVDIVLGSAATTVTRSAMSSAIGAAAGGAYGAVVGLLAPTLADIILQEELGENDTIMCGAYDAHGSQTVPVPTPLGTYYTTMTVPIVRGGVYYYPNLTRLPVHSTSELGDGRWLDTFAATELITDLLSFGGVNFPFDPPDTVGHIDFVD